MRKWVGLAGLLVSFIVGGLILWRIDLRSVLGQLSHFGWGAWFLGLAIYLLAFIPRGWRWKIMLPNSRALPWADVTRVLIIGYAANNILPFRLGELVRSVVGGSRFNTSKLTCLGTIAAEKILDGCCLLAFLAAILPLVTIREDCQVWLRRLGVLVALLFGLSLAACFALARGDQWLLPRARRWLPHWTLQWLQTGLAAFSSFKHWRAVLAAVLLTLVTWILEGLCFSYFLSRLGVSAALPNGFFCLVIVNLSILVPSAPGYLGVFQAGAVAAMLALGLDSTQGLALALVTHAAQFLPTTLLGLTFVAAMGFSWRQFYHLADA